MKRTILEEVRNCVAERWRITLLNNTYNLEAKKKILNSFFLSFFLYVRLSQGFLINIS